MWTGHGGLLFVSGKNKVLIDPYLSNTLRLVDWSFTRKKKIKRSLFALKPDVVAITSSQIDRNDWKTIIRIARGPFWFLGKFNFFYKFSKYRPTILSSKLSYWNNVKHLTYLKRSPFTMFKPGLEWSLGDMTIKAVTAITSDHSAFGLIITDNEDGKKYYVASNTLYSEELINSLPKDIFAAFIPIGGMFGSMNVIDASRFAKAIDAEYSVPVQFGTIDRVNPEEFIVGNRIIPKIYKVIDFNTPGGPTVSNNGINIFFNEKAKWKRKKKNSALPDDVKEIETDEGQVPATIDNK